MQTLVPYLRVSTADQGKSGLGLEAQEASIATFAHNNKCTLLPAHRDVQTGKGSDAMSMRPGLSAAFKTAQGARCAVIVAKLDRLSRDVHFISGLMKEKVPFYTVEHGFEVQPFMLHMYAAIAENERQAISNRTKVALAAKRARGDQLGVRTHKAENATRLLSDAGVTANRNAADDYARFMQPRVANIHASKPGATLREIAALLTMWGMKTPRGGDNWTPTAVANLLRRIEGLNA